MSTEVIFLGTGTSSSVPHIGMVVAQIGRQALIKLADCITAHAIPGSSDRPPCKTCLSTIDGTPEGKKNIRRNTSIIVRTPGKEGNVEAPYLSIAAKTFKVRIDALGICYPSQYVQAAALEWFPKYGLRRIDAGLLVHQHLNLFSLSVIPPVLITHAHSDAMNGLDDLRAWTLDTRIQSHIDIYVSEATFIEIKRAFPYLVSKEFASGGGDIPEFVWHVCMEDGVPFEVLDTSVMITPFLVNHGRLFTTPIETIPAAGKSVEGSAPEIEQVITPYMAMAFRIQQDFVYISDCGAIPDSAWPSISPSKDYQLPVCILDCLHLRSHPSHFGVEQAMIAARRIAAKRTYLLGFSHEIAHDEYVTLCEAVGGKTPQRSNLTENEVKGLSLIGEGEPIWVRPAHDGLRIQISRTDERDVNDETYL
ncbi:Lactamase-B domain-containing protein [Mycena indigotica]|uniref:Lactamase-B domain-containing protein n=1 Tax=Mycena indigotica TaxID=2126181 RepID=A0A8H6SXN8_9AGAR|nr:Lactamase-B domain-containing protein [Mycena indigotica]KAF7306566.1 Lactamase-B domain-containing protein [Mycena indigotica]